MLFAYKFYTVYVCACFSNATGFLHKKIDGAKNVKLSNFESLIRLATLLPRLDTMLFIFF